MLIIKRFFFMDRFEQNDSIISKYADSISGLVGGLGGLIWYGKSRGYGSV